MFDAIQDGLFPIEESAPFVLTVKQPWAWAIIHAGKDVENRSRALRYRGKLLIQAGLSYSDEGAKWMRELGVEPPQDLPRGVIVGSVDAVGTSERSSSRWAMEGHNHWLLSNPVAAGSLLPCRGALNLFRAPEGWEKAFVGPREAGTRKSG